MLEKTQRNQYYVNMHPSAPPPAPAPQRPVLCRPAPSAVPLEVTRLQLPYWSHVLPVHRSAKGLIMALTIPVVLS